MRRRAITLAAGLLVFVGLASADPHCPPSGVDELLRTCRDVHPALSLPIPEVGCRDHEQELASLEINGRTFPWEEYARWGRELFDDGFVTDPPAGPFDPLDPKRSLLISDFADYSCGRCHNDLREDPVLIDQDPEARFELIRAQDPPDFRTSRLKMVQGVTMYGSVNRMRFYNGLFSFFDSICVPIETTLYRSPENPEGRDYEAVDCSPARFAPCSPGCRQIDVASLRDSVQTCGRYCGVGRFMEDWELLGLLTHFWNHPVKLEEVIDSLRTQLADLTRQEPLPAQKIATVEWKLEALEPWLADVTVEPSIGACQALADSFLLTSCESLRDASPEDPDNEACSRDWTAPRLPVQEPDDPEDLPAMIRHIRVKSPGRPAADPSIFEESQGASAAQRGTDRPIEAFLTDPGVADVEPATEQLRRGKALYELSCGRCHGPSPEGRPQVGGRGHRFLVGSAYVYFKLIEDGLTPSTPIPPNPKDPSQESLYMPEFTLQRLSYQQAEDIYEYLLSLPPSGRVERQRPQE